jgi:hypothetical protein
MNTQLMGRVLAATFLCLTAAGCQGEEPLPEGDSLSTQEAQVEQQCVEAFKGIKTCALGHAAVKRTEKGIEVSGLEDVKGDGFSSQFGRASSYQMDIAVGGLGEKKQGIVLVARDGDEVVSTFQIGVGTDPDQMVLAPRFPGSTGGSAYTMSVYSRGTLVGSGINYDNYDRFFRPWWWDFATYWWPANLGFHDRIVEDEFGNLYAARSWSMSGGYQSFSVEVDGKLLTGDRLEFVEKLGDGPSSYDGFTAVDVKAAASQFTVMGASSSPRK